jgi:hypothetical protein
VPYTPSAGSEMLTTPCFDVTCFLSSVGATLIATIQDAALMGVIAVKKRARHLTTIVGTLFLIVLTLLHRPNGAILSGARC